MENFEFNKHFTKIYKTNEWGEGSGGGSSVNNTIEYRGVIKQFIKEHDIKTVIDYGCGDWQSSKLIEWGDCSYLGIDCVKHLIDDHSINYSSNTIKFECKEKLEDFFDYKGDLLILKDVMQHWINDEIIYFLDNVKNKFKFILITNSSHQKFDWEDTPYRSRPLSSNFFPLKKYNPIILKCYNTDHDTKEISLIR